jgi:threonine aldolase
VVARAREAGVLIVVLGPRTIRAVTHLDATRDGVARAAEVLVAAVASGIPA